jgi:hypothetical protein
VFFISTPARKLKKSAVKNIVRFPSIKANDGKTILVESIQESKYCLHLEFNSEVRRYWPQPPTYNFTDNLGDIVYTPDFKVEMTSGNQVICEVKPSTLASSEETAERLSRIKSYLEQFDLVFSVVTDIEIFKQPRLSNYEKLYQYRKRPSLDMANLHHCASLINGKLALSSVISKLSEEASTREIYTWLAFGYLAFNFDRDLLSIIVAS